MPPLPPFARLLLACVLLHPAVAGAADETLRRAEALLAAGSAQQAYQVLAPLQAARAGEPDYDYLLGVAALESGRNTEAVFALERVLALKPNDPAARAQIARAYFNLKETETARREFEAVRSAGLPAETLVSIDRYLAAIDQLAERDRLSARFFLEFAAGYDSNINGATDTAQFAVPSFPGSVFTLAPNSRKTSDAFFSAAAGLAARNALNQTWALIGGLSGARRVNLTESGFDTTYLDGYAGVTARHARETFTLVAQGNLFVVDDPAYSSAYRNALGGMAQWTHDFDARNQATAYVQYAALTYPDQAPRDADRTIAGFGYAHAFQHWNASAYFGLYGGVEKERDEAFKYLAHRPLGVRAGGQTALNDRTLLFVNAAAEWRKYRGEDPFFLETREDHQYSVGVGVHRLLDDRWRVSPQVTWFTNRSNILIDEYERWQAFVSLRRDW
jgi:tetratricopeptide (TPR) repeat protein